MESSTACASVTITSKLRLLNPWNLPTIWLASLVVKPSAYQLGNISIEVDNTLPPSLACQYLWISPHTIFSTCLAVGAVVITTLSGKLYKNHKDNNPLIKSFPIECPDFTDTFLCVVKALRISICPCHVRVLTPKTSRHQPTVFCCAALKFCVISSIVCIYLFASIIFLPISAQVKLS